MALTHNRRSLIHLHLDILKAQFTIVNKTKQKRQRMKRLESVKEKARYYNLACCIDELKLEKTLLLTFTYRN